MGDARENVTARSPVPRKSRPHQVSYTPGHHPAILLSSPNLDPLPPRCPNQPNTSPSSQTTATSSRSCAQQPTSPAPSRKHWTLHVLCAPSSPLCNSALLTTLSAGFRENTENSVNLPTIKCEHREWEWEAGADNA